MADKDDDDKDDSYDQKVKFVSVIAKPLASKKTTKKIHKLVKKATQAKIVRRGVKEVKRLWTCLLPFVLILIYLYVIFVIYLLLLSLLLLLKM